MVRIVFVPLLTLCVLGATWTGKVDKVYELSQLNLHDEGVHLFDGGLYTGSARGQNIFEFDEDDLDESTPAVVDTSGEDHEAGNQITLGLCSSSSKDRIYAAFASFDGSEQGGIGYWKKGDLKWGEGLTVNNQAIVNDCVVKGDYVYFTGSSAGPSVMVADLDLDAESYKEIYNGSLLAPTSQFGANGLVYMDDFLLVSHTDTGRIVKVPVKDDEADGDATTVSIVDSSNILKGGDGLIRVNDDVIIVVTAKYITLLETSDDWVSAEIKKTVDVSAIDAGGASTAALKSDDEKEVEIYVAFPGWVAFNAGTNQQNFKLALVKFSDEDIDDLSDDWAATLIAAVMLWMA